MSGWIFLSASTFILFRYIGLVGVHKNNPAPHRYVVSKVSVLIAFTDYCGYSHFTPYQNSGSSFFKVNCNVKPETM